MEYKLINDNNLNVSFNEIKIDLIYADMIYENTDFSWVLHYANQLKKDGIFIIQTDYHTVAEVKVYAKELTNLKLINWLVWKNEFGNFRKDRFRQCHDDILIFSNGENYKWYPERVQVEKATANSKGLNKSGRMTKLATSVISDICLTTVAKERIKDSIGKNIRWQKPLKLINRLLLPFTDENDWIIDPFMGTGTTGEWCIKNNRNFIGIEYDKNIYNIAKNRLGNL